MKRLWMRITAFAVMLLWSGAGAAADVETAQNLMFYFENDTFAGTDKNYTNAVKLSWVSEDVREYEEIKGPLLKRSPVINRMLRKKGYLWNVGLSMGQNIYTPENTETDELVADERPYAGLLYIALAVHRKNVRLLDTLELTLGVVGPLSLAEDAQRFVHDVIGIDSPDGWDHQLENEPGLALTWQRSWRMLTGGEPGGWSIDLIPHIGATAGNIQTYVNGGFGFRFGYNIPKDFGTSLARPAGNVSAAADEDDPRFSRTSEFSLYGFLRAEGRAVAWNVFLDGNTWRDSHSVDKKPFVADASAGVALVYKSVKLAYAHVYRTREYDRQDEGQIFGSVSLTITY